MEGLHVRNGGESCPKTVNVGKSQRKHGEISKKTSQSRQNAERSWGDIEELKKRSSCFRKEINTR